VMSPAPSRSRHHKSRDRRIRRHRLGRRSLILLGRCRHCQTARPSPRQNNRRQNGSAFAGAATHGAAPRGRWARMTSGFTSSNRGCDVRGIQRHPCANDSPHRLWVPARTAAGHRLAGLAST
jgi:hypothetical protein